jgi:hypothetical protein
VLQRSVELAAQTGHSALAGSRVEVGLQHNLDDLPVVEADGVECGK